MNPVLHRSVIALSLIAGLVKATYASDEFATRCLESRKKFANFSALVVIEYPTVEGFTDPSYSGIRREFDFYISDSQDSAKIIQKWVTPKSEWLDVVLYNDNGLLTDRSPVLHGTFVPGATKKRDRGIDPRLFGITTDPPASVGMDFPARALWFVEKAVSSNINQLQDEGTTVRKVVYDLGKNRSVEVWYSPAHGYNPVNVVLRDLNHLTEERIASTYQPVSTSSGEAWFPASVSYTMRVKGEVVGAQDAVISAVNVGGLDKEVFSIASLPLKQGRKIMSNGMGYKFSDGALLAATPMEKLDVGRGVYVSPDTASLSPEGHFGMVAFVNLLGALLLVVVLIVLKVRKKNLELELT